MEGDMREPERSKCRRVVLSIKLRHHLYFVSAAAVALSLLLDAVAVDVDVDVDAAAAAAAIDDADADVTLVVKFRPDSFRDLRLVLIEIPSRSATKIEASKLGEESKVDDSQVCDVLVSLLLLLLLPIDFPPLMTSEIVALFANIILRISANIVLLLLLLLLISQSKNLILENR